MANFIGLVYATLKNEGIDTKGMDTDTAVAKYNELQKKDGGKAGEKEGTPAEQRALKGEQSKKENKEVKGTPAEEKRLQETGITNYPAGTSKEYTEQVNKKYEKALPTLEKMGIKPSDFGGKASKEGGYEDNTGALMEKYVFAPFEAKYPKGNNEVWEKEYQPIYNAIEAVADKNYNDWYIKNRPNEKK